MDETYVRIAGRWMYLFRAVDDRGQTVDFYLSETRDRDAAKRFLQAALANPDNRPPHVLTMDGNRSYPAAIRELKNAGAIRPACRHRCRQYENNRIESDHRHVKRRLRAMQGPRTWRTAWAIIQGIEAGQMIRKGQVLGIGRNDRHGQAGSSRHCSVLLESSRADLSAAATIWCPDATLPTAALMRVFLGTDRVEEVEQILLSDLCSSATGLGRLATILSISLWNCFCRRQARTSCCTPSKVTAEISMSCTGCA
jgi:IS6 family transposase